MPTILYVYEERIPEALRALVLSYFPPAEFSVEQMSYQTPLSEQTEKLAHADAVLCAPGRFLPDEAFRAARRARLIQLWSSGFDKFNVAGATAAGIPVATNGGANAVSVAEHAVLLMLAVAHRLPQMDKQARSGAWGGASYGLDRRTLQGKRLGIVGFGTIGRKVAEKVAGFGMDIVYYDTRRATPDEEKRLAAKFLGFDEILRTSDVLTVHLHLNKATRHMIDARAFSLMKKGVILVNAARAELVDKKALCKALADNSLRGAGLDVFDAEPPPADDELFSLPSIVATPHMGGSNRDAYEEMMKRSLANIRRALKGEDILWSVNGLTRRKTIT